MTCSTTYGVIVPNLPDHGSTFRCQAAAIRWAALMATMFGHALIVRRGRLLCRLRPTGATGHPWALTVTTEPRRVLLPGEEVLL